MFDAYHETPDPEEPVGAVDDPQKHFPLFGVLPSGEWMKIRKLLWKKREWSYHVTDDIHMLMRFGAKPKGGKLKGCLPHAELFGERASYIGIDIDSEYYSKEVEDYLIDLAASNRITAARSSSGRVKGFLPVKHFGGRLNAMDAIKTLKREFGEDLASRCDRGGLDRTFVNEGIWEAIRFAKTIPAVKASRERSHVTLKRIYYFSEDEMAIVESNLPPGTPNQRARWARELEIAASMAGRGMKGRLDLCGGWLANELFEKYQISICERTIERDILVLKDALECVNPKWIPFRKAKTYKYAGWFREMMGEKLRRYYSLSENQILVDTPKPNNDATSRKPLPVPSAGNWYASLWAATNHFKSEEGFLSWVRNLPGIEKKGRLGVAKRAWRNHIKG